MSNPKPISYWENPRESIATRYKDADCAYFTSGMKDAATVLKMLDLPLTELSELRLLDFGCGTGRTARPLAFFFREVIGYDPSHPCITTALRECEPLLIKNLRYTSTLDHSSDLCDFGVSVNVLEHLGFKDQGDALALLKNHVKKDGKLILWYHPKDNGNALCEYFPNQPFPGVGPKDKPGIYIHTFSNV